MVSNTFQLLLVLLLASISTALPRRQDEFTPEWIVWNAHRTKTADNTVCEWSLVINETMPSATSPTSNDTTSDVDTSYDCSFQVVTPEGQDCGLKDIKDHKCTSNEAYKIEGGHSDQGFIVMVITNDRYGSAYFGFSDHLLDSGADIPAQKKQPSHIGPVEPKRDIQGDMDPGIDPVNEEPFSTLVSVKSMEWYAQDSNGTVFLNFTIGIDEKYNQSSTSYDRNCELHLQAPNDTLATQWSWYDRQCEGSDYYVSWGYAEVDNSVTMTLVNPQRDGRAFFGFHDVVSSSHWVTQGPNPMEPCRCG
ncbi:hypothetical protein F5Y15DRAFT_422808 [Xylariaceae sp. FL0016]|nr:hypothetical protein F5Y15DRAFT_422808 [Xylariaceae sp. FL0016]